MRKILYYEYVKNIPSGRYDKHYKGKALFHQFSVLSEETKYGVLNNASAIIELKDGSVKNMYIELIKFIKE